MTDNKKYGYVFEISNLTTKQAELLGYELSAYYRHDKEKSGSECSPMATTYNVVEVLGFYTEIDSLHAIEVISDDEWIDDQIEFVANFINEMTRSTQVINGVIMESLMKADIVHHYHIDGQEPDYCTLTNVVEKYTDELEYRKKEDRESNIISRVYDYFNRDEEKSDSFINKHTYDEMEQFLIKEGI
jgi:hypothetical protein